MAFETILAHTIPIFLIVAIGLVVRRTGVVNDEAQNSLMRLILNVLYPCFILSKVIGNDVLDSGSIVAVSMGLGTGMILLSFAVCYGVGRLIGLDESRGLNTFVVAVGIQNYGFIPIPLVEGLYPPEVGDRILGVMFMHNLGVEIAMWTAGIVILSGKTKGALRRLIRGPTIAIAAGLLINATGAEVLIPGVVSHTMHLLGLCHIPISVLLVGVTLGCVLEDKNWQLDWPIVTASTLLRFALFPAIYLTAAVAITFSNELQQVLVLQAAMPTAIFPVVLSRFFGGKPGVAVQVVLATSLLSLVLTPTIIKLGLVLIQ